METIRTRNSREKDIFGGCLLTLVILIVFNVCQLSRGNPVFVDNPSLAQFQSGRNIRNLPCIVRKSGLSGVCMFAIDCIKQNGTHLGTCIDRFYFGSCCQIKTDSQVFAEEISDNSIDQNTISHFGHESSTLSTSSIFKIPTEGQTDKVVSKNHSTLHPYIPVSTITHMTSKLESTTMRFITSRRPTETTTVVSATVKPQTSTTSAPRRRPTTTFSTLTIAPDSSTENIFDSTTIPSRLTTFQIVETTPRRPTEPTTFEDISYTTTMKLPILSRKPTTDSPRTKKPIITKIPAANFTSPPTTTRSTSKTTPKYKPNQSKRPTTTRKPYSTKRPVTTTTQKTKYTRKPTIHPEFNNSATLPPTKNDSSIFPSTIKATVTTEPPTRAPRPKPKPTGEIFKIRPTIATEPTTLKVESRTTTSTTETPVSPTTSTASSTTTSTALPTSTTPEKTTTATSTMTTTRVPETTSPISTSSTKVTATSTTSTSEKPSTTERTTSSTTQRIITTEQSSEPTSTYPALVTWTSVDDNRMNNTHVTIEETAWQPKPPPAGWVPVPTINPDFVSKNSTDFETSLTGLTTEGIEMSSTTESSIVKPSSTATSSPLNFTSTSSVPTLTSTTIKTPSTTNTSVEEPVSSTSSRPVPVTNSSTETLAESFTDNLSTTDFPTEDFNATTSVPFTTMSSIPSLEGVDYRKVCGRRMFPEPRIVGGSNAAFGRWPWQISLRQWRTSTYLHKCGAALLNENWAITAAHCVDNVPPSDLLLRLGEYDLAEEEEPYGYQERRVQIVASHPQFDPRTFEYDLALLRFYEPVVFQPNIIPVCVPDSDENFIGQTAFVTGWGRLYEDGPLPSVLQEVAVPIINNTICETMYRAAGYIEYIPHIFICAGWKKGGYDSCEGDSGGPMVLQRETDKRFMLGGVISWGIGCAEPNQPGIYTRISEFRDWINQILQF